MVNILSKETLGQEVDHIRKVFPKVVGIGKKHFSETLPSDDQIRGFFIETAPHTPQTLFPNFWEHPLLASIYAYEMASQIKDPEIVNPEKALAVSALADAGRLIIPHRYYVNDLVGHALLRSIGIGAGLVEDMAPLDRILGLRDPLGYFSQLTLFQMIDHIADNLGKRDSIGQLRSVEDVLNASSGRAYPKKEVWPAEDKALDLLNQPGKEVWANDLVIQEMEFFQRQFRMDFGALREKVWVEFQTEKNQQYLRTVQEAQISGR